MTKDLYFPTTFATVREVFNLLLLITHKSCHVVHVPNLFHSFIFLFIIFYMWPQAMFCIVSSTTHVKVRSTVVPITTLPSTANLHKNLDVVNHHPHPHVPNGTTTPTGKFKSAICRLSLIKIHSQTQVHFLTLLLLFFYKQYFQRSQQFLAISLVWSWCLGRKPIRRSLCCHNQS